MDRIKKLNHMWMNGIELVLRFFITSPDGELNHMWMNKMQ